MAEPAPDVAVGWLVDKPAGPTSHDVVAIVRRGLARRTRVGHTGTLDPFATGLLVVLAGRATRLVRYLTGLPKTYVATIRLGETSVTGDPEGPIAPGGPVPGEAEVRAAVDAMRGPQTQATPAYSAVKVGGEALYRKARRGEDVEGPTRDIVVHDIRAEAFDADRHDVVVRMRVSSGTYVRQIAADLGAALGCGGYCLELRRTEVGDLSVDDAVAPADAAAAPPVPLSRLVAHLPHLEVDDAGAARLAHGVAVDAGDARGELALVHGGALVAIAEAVDGRLRPRVVLAGASPQAVPRA